MTKKIESSSNNDQLDLEYSLYNRDMEIQEPLIGLNDREIHQDDYREGEVSSDQKTGFHARLISTICAMPRCVWNSGPWSTAVAAFAYSVALLAVKIISDEVQIFEILVTRSVVSIIITIMIQWRTGQKPFYGQYKHFHLLFLRGLFGSTAFMSFYYSLALLSLGDAMAIFYVNAAPIAVLGWFFLKQKIDLFGLIGIFFSIAGVMFVSHPPFIFGSHQEWRTQRIMGLILALISCLMGATAYVLVRVIGKREGVLTISLWFYTFSLAGIIPVVLNYPYKPKIPNFFEILMLSIVSFGSYFAQIMLTRGFQIGKASRIAAINYLAVAFGYLWGLAFLGNPITWYGILGALFIAIGVFLVNKEPADKGDDELIKDNDPKLISNETIIQNQIADSRVEPHDIRNQKIQNGEINNKKINQITKKFQQNKIQNNYVGENGLVGNSQG